VRNFEFLEPRSPQEASRMLAESGEEARLFAGGTALMLAMRQRMLTPSHVVYLGGVPGLNRIEFDERNGLRIGALALHIDVADSEIVKQRYPVIAGMAAHVANPQVRNQGTIGGNLCYGDPATDPPGCLMAHAARVRVVGPQGERTIELDDFFTDYYQTALEPNEVVTEIQVPTPAADAKGAYTRFLRTPAEHRPLVSVAVVARRNGKLCREVRIIVGASVPIPTRVRRAEQFLEGKSITREVLEEAAAIAAADLEPVSDFRGSADYRREMIRTVVRRTAAKVFDHE
jgi:carbon-monoxide dehydrogenase medium subunit